MGSYRMNRSGVRSVLAVSLFFISVHLEAAPDESRLWFKQPARDWNEALPVGNGRLAAMVFGQVNMERIQLNEESLWSGQKINNKNPEFLKHLQEIQQLLLDGKNIEAVRLAEKNLLGTPPHVRSYLSLGDLWLDQFLGEAPEPRIFTSQVVQ